MSQIVPTFNIGTVNYVVTLNNVSYFLRTYWNEYALMWFMDISDINQNPIAIGLALVPDVNILGFSRFLTTTIGQLRISSTDGNTNTTSLGVNSILYYFVPGEFETLYPDYLDQSYRDLQFDFDSLFSVVP